MRKNIVRAILAVVGVAGLVGVASVAPNTIVAMKKLGLIPNSRQASIINRARERLIKRGFLKRSRGGFLELTSKGREAYLRIQAEESLKKRSRRWDGRWRLLIFDIPERFRRTRDTVRHALQRSGFYRLQDSAWVYPHDCEDFIAFLKADLKVGRNVLYLVVEEMEGSKNLKDHFGLR